MVFLVAFILYYLDVSWKCLSRVWDLEAGRGAAACTPPRSARRRAQFGQMTRDVVSLFKAAHRCADHDYRACGHGGRARTGTGVRAGADSRVAVFSGVGKRRGVPTSMSAGRRPSPWRTRQACLATGALPTTPAWLVLMAALLAGPSVGCGLESRSMGVAALHVFLGAFFYGVVYTVWLKRRSWLNIVIGRSSGVLAARWRVPPGALPCCPWLALVLFFVDTSALLEPRHRQLRRLRPGRRADCGRQVPSGRHVVFASTVALFASKQLLLRLRCRPAVHGRGALGGGLVRHKSLLARNPARTAHGTFFASLVQLSLLLGRACIDAMLSLGQAVDGSAVSCLASSRPSCSGSCCRYWAWPVAAGQQTPARRRPTSRRSCAPSNARQRCASQAAIGRIDPRHTLLDRDGRPVPLAHYRGKPLLVSFHLPAASRSARPPRARCSARCSRCRKASARHVQRGERRLQPARRFAAGDARLRRAVHRIAEPNWDFLSPSPAAVERADARLRLQLCSPPRRASTMSSASAWSTPRARLRQVYGDVIPTSSANRCAAARGATAAGECAGTLVDRVRIICTVYDPETGTYRTNYGLIEIAGGVMFFVLMLMFFLVGRGARGAAPDARQFHVPLGSEGPAPVRSSPAPAATYRALDAAFDGGLALSTPAPPRALGFLMLWLLAVSGIGALPCSTPRRRAPGTRSTRSDASPWYLGGVRAGVHRYAARCVRAADAGAPGAHIVAVRPTGRAFRGPWLTGVPLLVRLRQRDRRLLAQLGPARPVLRGHTAEWLDWLLPLFATPLAHFLHRRAA